MQNYYFFFTWESESSKKASSMDFWDKKQSIFRHTKHGTKVKNHYFVPKIGIFVPKTVLLSLLAKLGNI